MVSGRNESKLGQESLEIKRDDKFFTRIMSKDTSMANASTRVYYGGASGSVPFTWETRPGTPKHTFSDSSIPPLTPPPSYFSRSRSRSRSRSKSKSIQNSIFPRFRKKSNHVSPSSSMSSTTTATTTTTTSSSSFSASSSCSSWSSSFHSSPSVSNTRTRMCFSCSSSSIHDNEDDDDEDDADVVDKDERGFGSRASRLRRNGVNKGRCLMKNMKNVFLSIVGHGSS